MLVHNIRLRFPLACPVIVRFSHTVLLVGAVPVMPHFPLDQFHAIEIAPLESGMNVDVLLRVLGPVKPVHVELPDERCHVLVLEVEGQHFVRKRR